MSHIGEFDLIRRISASVNATGTTPSGVTGIGDDCAVIPQHAGLDTLVTTDLLIEGRHFLLEDITPFELGWKSAAVNISDIAGMGGNPTGAFLSIALPKGRELAGGRRLPGGEGRCSSEDGSHAWPGEGRCFRPERHSRPDRESPDTLQVWMDDFIQGFNALCGRFGVPLLGGDTSASDDKLFINVTLLGECPHGRAVLRSGARAGDIIYVTGPLGDSAAGLKLILERTSGAVGQNQIVGEGSQEFGGQTLVLERASTCLYDAEAGQLLPGHPGLGAPAAFSADFAAGPPTSGCPGITPEVFLVRRHYLPEPRVALGQALAALPGVHSMMDISDGIASDLRHILEASSAEIAGQAGNDASPASLNDVEDRHSRLDRESMMSEGGGRAPRLAAEVDVRSIPLSEALRSVCEQRGWDAAELAVSGGEDYELLFTAAPGTEVPEGCVAIGRIIALDGEGEDIRWIGSDKDYKGFTHF